MNNSTEETISLLRETADKLENGDATLSTVAFREAYEPMYEYRLDITWTENE